MSSPLAILVLAVVLGAENLVAEGEPKAGGGGVPLGVPGASRASAAGGGGVAAVATFLANFFL